MSARRSSDSETSRRERFRDVARESLSAYVQVPSFTDEAAIFREVEQVHRRVKLDRIECLWEPFMVLAAKLRERLGVPGMSVRKTIPFRDKEIMKQGLDAAGIRTPRHASVTSVAGCREAAASIGFPDSDRGEAHRGGGLGRHLPRGDRARSSSAFFPRFGTCPR